MHKPEALCANKPVEEALEAYDLLGGEKEPPETEEKWKPDVLEVFDFWTN